MGWPVRPWKMHYTRSPQCASLPVCRYLRGAFPTFRHLLEEHQLGQVLFEEVRSFLGEPGLLLKSGTIVDASLIDAPSCTKNKEGKRDPEMHQTRKGNQWYFGMKMHIAVDDMTGVVYSLVSTTANVNDVTQAGHLLHGDEERTLAMSVTKASRNDRSI